jgi:hypothetical protein
MHVHAHYNSLATQSLVYLISRNPSAFGGECAHLGHMAQQLQQTCVRSRHQKDTAKIGDVHSCDAHCHSCACYLNLNTQVLTILSTTKLHHRNVHLSAVFSAARSRKPRRMAPRSRNSSCMKRNAGSSPDAPMDRLLTTVNREQPVSKFMDDESNRWARGMCLPACLPACLPLHIQGHTH